MGGASLHLLHYRGQHESLQSVEVRCKHSRKHAVEARAAAAIMSMFAPYSGRLTPEAVRLMSAWYRARGVSNLSSRAAVRRLRATSKTSSWSQPDPSPALK